MKSKELSKEVKDKVIEFHNLGIGYKILCKWLALLAQ